MRLQARHGALSLLLLCGSGCTADPTGAFSMPTSGFERHVLDPAAPLPPLTLTVPEKRMLSVAGALPTPCQPYWAAARDTRSDSTLTITVEAYPTATCPPEALPGALGYTYVFFSLPPGRYQLVVVHHYLSEALPLDTAYRRPVVIP